MEEYDVLGNFRNMRNIFRRIPTAAPFQPTYPPIMEASFEDADILVDGESSTTSVQTSNADLLESPIVAVESKTSATLADSVVTSEENLAAERPVVATFSSPALISGAAAANTGTDKALHNTPSKTKTQKTNQPKLMDFFDELNPEISIKLLWQFHLKTYKLRKYQKFSLIFEQLSKSENIAIEHISLNLHYKIVKPDDTPASIDYKVYQFIEGRAMNGVEFAANAVTAKAASPAAKSSQRDPNVIQLKVQSDKFKKPLQLDLLKSDNFQVLAIKCAEELKLPVEQIIKLCFDGETLVYEQTPMDLEFEGGEVIEIYLKD